MSAQVGVPTNFNATLQDNGSPIPLPAGSAFDWTSDDPSDQITILNETTEDVQVIVTNGPPNRTTMTLTASTTAPDGSTVSGSLDVDLIPGAPTHVYTVSVNQVFATPVRGTKGRRK